jgi:hypothetical protein
LQVSFVATNQVDEKLVPIESVARSITHEPNGVAGVEKKLGKSLLQANLESNPYFERIYFF